MKKKANGRFHIVLILIAVFLCGFGLNLAIDGGASAPRELTEMIVTPFRTAGVWIKNTVSDFFSSVTDYKKLADENEALRIRISELEAELDKSYTLKVENERLNSLIGITGTEREMTLLAADVVSLSSGGWISSFTINKGTADGVSKKDVVICADGLVGKVTYAGLYWSTVVTVIDPQIAVGATVAGTGSTGMTEGTLALKAKGQCRLSYLGADAEIVRGDRVRTSGLGGIYPEGIIIGTVKDIVLERNGLTQYAVIEPAADLKNLRRVYIITSFEAEG